MRRPSTQKSQTASTSTAEDLSVQQQCRFLSTSLDHDWKLEEMAVNCGVKRTQLATITKRLTDYAPAQYLQRVRFDKSCELLRNTKLPITEIALECGYSCSQYYSETFKNQARITPSEYRQNVQELDAIMKINWDYPELRSLAEEEKRTRIIPRIR